MYVSGVGLRWVGLGCGWGGSEVHLPLLADEKEEEHHQARDECQADPDNGPGIIAGSCRKAWSFATSSLLCSHATLH